MWLQFKAWVIHLFTVHCVDCIESTRCQNCDQLYQLLERERIERNKLIDLLTPKQITDNEVEVNYENINRPLTWAARREQLEQQARELARSRDANQ